jgi:hypothetical protein
MAIGRRHVMVAAVGAIHLHLEQAFEDAAHKGTLCGCRARKGSLPTIAIDPPVAYPISQ